MSNPTPEQYNSLLKENSRLTRRVKEMQEEIDLLNAKLHFSKSHPTLVAGLKGERLISGTIDGILSVRNASHDVTTQNNVKIEVKFSSVRPSEDKSKPCYRWQWNRVIKRKTPECQSQLILIGVKDPNHMEMYTRDLDCPYILFDVPYEEIRNMTTSSGPKGTERMIRFTTNIKRVRGEGRSCLNFETSISELKTKYGF